MPQPESSNPAEVQAHPDLPGQQGPPLMNLNLLRLESPRSRASRRNPLELDGLLREVNRIRQSQSQCELRPIWGHVGLIDLPEEAWREVLYERNWSSWESLSRPGWSLILADLPGGFQPGPGVGLLPDDHPVTARSLANDLAQLEQLARTASRDHPDLSGSSHGILSSPTPTLGPECLLKMKIQLVRGTPFGFSSSPKQAQDWFRQAAVIWAQARIRLEVEDWGEAVVSTDLLLTPEELAASSDGLTVYWVHSLPEPQRKLTRLCRALPEKKLLLVSERFHNDPPGRSLARSLASYLGLALTRETPSTWLTTAHCGGTVLSAEQIRQARKSLSGPKARELRLQEIARLEPGPLLVHQLADSSWVTLQLPLGQLRLDQLQIRRLRNQIQESLCQELEAPFRLDCWPPQAGLVWVLWREPEGFRFDLQGRGIQQNYTLSLEAGAELCTRLGRALQSYEPEWEIEVLGFEDPCLVSLDGTHLRWIPEISQILGPEEEILSPADLQTGDRLSLQCMGDLSLLRGRLVQGGKTYQSLWETACQASDTLSQQASLADLGERADLLIFRGQAPLAESLYGGMYRLLQEHQIEHPSLLAKMTLGTMLARAYQADAHGAYDIWMREAPEQPYGSGIQELEQGRVTPRDYAIYRLVCAWLYRLGPRPEIALERLNQTLEALIPVVPAELKPTLMEHWWHHLSRLFPGHPPQEATQSYRAAGGEGGPPAPFLDYPRPDRWRT